MFAVIDELLSKLDLKEELRVFQFVAGARPFMRTRLLQVDAPARTIQRHLALCSTTLRTNSPVHRGAKALFFPRLADGATHCLWLLIHYDMPGQAHSPLGGNIQRHSKACFQGPFVSATPEQPVVMPPFMVLLKKNRKKCGLNATFPQRRWYKMPSTSALQILGGLHGSWNDQDSTRPSPGREDRAQQQDCGGISRAAGRHSHQRNQEERHIRSPRPRPPSEGAPQGPRRTQPADRRTHSDQGQDGGEVPRRQGRQGRDRPQEVVSRNRVARNGSARAKGRRHAGLLFCSRVKACKGRC